MLEPVEVRLLFFVDREGVARVRVASDGRRGSVYRIVDGLQGLVNMAEVFDARAARAVRLAGSQRGAVSEPLNDEKGGTP